MKKLALLFLASMIIMTSQIVHSIDSTTDTGEKSSHVTASELKKNQARLEALAVLIKRQQYPQAFELADRLAFQYEGDATFDFQYGLSAVETRHYDEALFAFERLVIGAPEQSRYRAELARTHFYLHNLIRAKIEFEKVLKQNPPEAVQKNVTRFLEKIKDLQHAVQPRFMFAMDMAGGFDSNINSATDELALDLIVEDVLFQDVPLNDDARETSSGYWSTLLNFGYLSPLTKTSSYDVRLIYSNRTNSETDLYNLDTAMAEVGFGFFTGRIRWRMAGRYQYVQLNSEEFLNNASVILQSQYVLRRGARYGLTMNLGQSSYPDNKNGDLTQQSYNFSYTSAPKKHSWMFALILGADNASENVNEYNAKSYQGFTYQSTYLWGQRGSRYWLFNLISSEYDAINPANAELRKDTAITLGVGLRFAFNSSFSVRNDYSFNYTDSTIVANTYKRAKVEFGLTYSF
jgi:tetratricopeptide (TPR) repeat protein